MRGDLKLRWSLLPFLKDLPGLTGSFGRSAPPFDDPYQDIIDRCQPHPHDPAVLLTYNREDMRAVHSPRIAAVVWIRDVSEELKAEVATLQANPNIHQIEEDYRWAETPPAGLTHIRDDMRMIAHLRADLAGEHLTRPVLKARAKDHVDQTLPRLQSPFAGDSGFHSDRADVGLRLHATYSGERIKGLSSVAIARLEKDGIITDTTFKDEAARIEENISPQDIVDDIPLFAVVAFKGKGYKPPADAPDLGQSAPAHIHWRHRGPDRDRTDGIAAIFGRPYEQVLIQEAKLPFPAARI